MFFLDICWKFAPIPLFFYDLNPWKKNISNKKFMEITEMFAFSPKLGQTFLQKVKTGFT